MLKSLTSALACVVWVLAAASSQAVITTSMETELFGPGTPNFDQLLNFNKFDPSLGTLLSVKVKLDISTSGGSLTVDNDGGQPATVAVALGASGALSSVDVNLLDTAFQNVTGTVVAQTTGSFNLGADNGDGTGNVDGTGPDGAVLSGGNVSSMNMGFINPLFHAGYTGAGGNYNIKIDANQILNFGGVGGVEGAFTPVSASGNVMVTYEYDRPVPEPASLALFGLGIAGALAYRRTRNAA